jgi:predicted alpha/beta superfamily hydrolase
MPAKAGAYITNDEVRAAYVERYGVPLSDEYLRFIVTEVKPMIDGRYRTLRDRAHTFIMGSSMGGLISLYALCEYPEVFGGAGCLSTHWPAGDGAMIAYLRAAVPEPAAHRLYFDHGTQTLDATYEEFQRRVDEVVRARGYGEGTNWITRRFPGHEHSERAWRERVHIPLEFLLRGTSTASPPPDSPTNDNSQ